MLIKSPNSVNVYRPSYFPDTIVEDGEISEGEWRANLIPDSFYSLQVPRTGHNASLYVKSVREKFMDYFVSDGAVDNGNVSIILCKIGKKHFKYYFLMLFSS